MKRALVVTLERLNPVFLGFHGSFAGRTRQFDRLASQSAIFDQHFGENFDPERVSDGWWTGCYTFPRSKEEQRRLPSFLNQLRRTGVRTRLVCSPNVSALPFAEKSFERVDVLCRPLEQDRDGAEATQAVLQAWRELQREEAGLLWLALDGLPTRTSAMDGDEASNANPTADCTKTAASRNRASERDKFLARDCRHPDDSSRKEGQSTDGLMAGSLDEGFNDAGAAEAEGEDAWSPSGRAALDRLLGPLDSADSLTRTLQHADALVGRLRSELAEPAAAEDADGFLWILATAGGIEIPAATHFRGFRLLLNESVVRGTQIVWLPKEPSLRGRLQQLVQTVDLGPTLLDWFAVDTFTPLEGRSWLPLLEGRSAEWREFICLGMGLREVAVRTASYYLVTDRWQLQEPLTENGRIAEGTPISSKATTSESADALHDDPTALAELIEQAGKYCRLFVKPDDIWNVNDVAQQAPEDVLHLRRLLHEFILSKQGSSSDGGPDR